MYIGVTELQVELEKDTDKELISAMCVRNKDDCIQFKFFVSASSLSKFAKEFQIISDSGVFLGFWKRTLSQAIVDNSQLSLHDLYDSVWQPSLGLCRKLLESLVDQSMKLSDVDTDLQPYRDCLDLQLQLLHDKMAQISEVESRNFCLIKQAAEKVGEYWNLCQYQKGADTFLKLKNSLGLSKGDFQPVERLSQQVKVDDFMHPL